jgi:hypothetical protein
MKKRGRPAARAVTTEQEEKERKERRHPCGGEAGTMAAAPSVVPLRVPG